MTKEEIIDTINSTSVEVECDPRIAPIIKTKSTNIDIHNLDLVLGGTNTGLTVDVSFDNGDIITVSGRIRKDEIKPVWRYASSVIRRGSEAAVSANDFPEYFESIDLSEILKKVYPSLKSIILSEQILS